MFNNVYISISVFSSKNSFNFKKAFLPLQRMVFSSYLHSLKTCSYVFIEHTNYSIATCLYQSGKNFRFVYFPPFPRLKTGLFANSDFCIICINHFFSSSLRLLYRSFVYLQNIIKGLSIWLPSKFAASSKSCLNSSAAVFTGALSLLPLWSFLQVVLMGKR